MKVDIDWLQRQFPFLTDLGALSEGGQKVVFAAKHTDHGDVVLKLIHPSQGEQSVARERLAVDRVQSQRVPRILEFGELETTLGVCYWFLEQRIVGVCVRQLVANSQIACADVVRMGIHMLEALVKAEQVKIVHRDIKPENIIRDRSGCFWLLDFGISRHLTLAALTDVSSRWGKFTPGYAPPEQFRNLQSEIDIRSDLFALGVTLYECLTGRHPYWEGSTNELEVLRKVEMTVPPPVPLVFAPKQLSELIATCMQRRRDHRPRTAEDTLEWMLEISQTTQ